ncbi:MAG: S9 family peptidase [Prevotella sp.]|nr:S9 family peptidase [Prevotella sp.]
MKYIATLPLMLAALSATAQNEVTVDRFNLAGPFAVSKPFQTDTVNINGKKWSQWSFLDIVSHDAPATATAPSDSLLPTANGQKSVGVLSFYLNNTAYTEATITIKGPYYNRVFLDGIEQNERITLSPDHHTIAVKYLAEPSDSDSIRITIDAAIPLQPTLSPQHPYMLHDLTDGRRIRGARPSADGRVVILTYQTTERGGQSRWDYELREASTQRLLSRPSEAVRWMPRTCAYIEEVQENGHRMLYTIDPFNGQRTLFAANLPAGSYRISPTEDFIILTDEEEGPKDDDGVFEVTEMDDRQPGWRDRTFLVHYDCATGVGQRITFGRKGEVLYDISRDGSKLLFATSCSRLQRRPTTVTTLMMMDVKTHEVDTVLTDAEFIGGAVFSPDGSKLLIEGTPEAFNRVGCQLPDNAIPSMTETELFLFDIASGTVTPLTRDFDPSIEDVEWSQTDGQIYFSAEDRDYVRLFRMNPDTGGIEQLSTQGDYTYYWTLASCANAMTYLTYDTMAPASAYLSTWKQKGRGWTNTCLFNGRNALGDAQLGTCQDWNFQNSNGDTVYGRLYLPADFDPSKKYPMIVYYYGGCSPVSRYFESPYAPQMWTSLGYVAYILQPSGATGFGQEWASRHVNTAGGEPRADGTMPGGTPAGDIIEGVQRICDEHPFINREKIGCMGASYGGFMTQYLQTVTDIFACAVSHAGIANHTSYWGEGYWGYNYSEVSMANSYPWSHRQLYVDQSPLFRADKIHTPLLLLHGNADTNVPLIESLQMFTALKLLGREVALVEVEGENHHIQDYKKREKWIATQMAWFQHWLKDDSSWWDALYPHRNM